MRVKPSARTRLVATSAAVLTAGVAVVAVPQVAQAADTGVPQTFGNNGFGQLGDGSALTVQRTSPGPVSGLGNVTKVAGGREHALALRTDGTVAAWGHNDKGQVGDGTSTAVRSEPVDVTGLSGVVDIGTGHYHSLAVKSDGTAWVWGFNALGQLGDGTTTNRNRPQRFGSFTTVVQAVGGRDMSYVRLADGTVWCAGSNASGECGDGTTTQRRTPVQVSGLTGIVDVAGGRNHGLALDDTGRVWAWGLNSSGQLGDGTTTNRTRPVQISGLANVVDVAAGADHSVAVLADGTVKTWGKNLRGELGLGDTANRLVPTTVAGITDAASADSGRDHTMVITSDGSLFVWGWNQYGQAGDPSLSNVLRPRQVPGVSGALSAAGGQAYTVVLTSGAPDTTPPSEPGKPTASSTAPGTVDLSWSAATDDQATTLTYTVRRDDGTTATTAGTVRSAASTVTFRDPSAVPGSIVQYDVRASDGTNVGSWSVASDPVTVQSGGTSTVWSDDFGNGLAAWTGVTRLTVDNALGAVAPPSVRGAVTSTTSSAWRSTGSTLNQACVTLAVRVEAQSSSLILLRLRTSGGASIARLIVGTDRRLRVRSDVALVTSTTSLTLPLGTWQTVGLCLRVAGTSGTLSASSGGTTSQDYVLDTGTTGVGRVQIGASSAATATFNLDDVALTTQ